MCGILGAISLKEHYLYDTQEFSDALELLSHRGPDDSDILQHKKFIFGHQRLSIIDLNAHAKQPMASSCKNYTVVFNGEIYNYQEIREDLIKKGYKFTTDSDTEVLLNSYIEHGIDCIKLFIGMFAFVINDQLNDVTFVVRDRLGIKPLYYSKDDKSFIFSSEVKAILSLQKNIKRKLNLDAISSYLSFRYPILNDTFFENIHSLPPAHYIKISKSQIEVKEYWSLIEHFNEQKNDKGEAYYISKTREILSSSVKYRMISDVPIGSFLSGGVDSSIITAIMAKNSRKPVKTFTIGFEEMGFNEFEFAKLIADKYETQHNEITLSGKNYINTMESLISFKDAPLSVPNEVPLYLMSKELKKSITVVLSGEGADEIFGGYGRIFRSPYDYDRIKNIDNKNYTVEEKEELCKNFIKKYISSSFKEDINHFMSIYSYTSFDEKKRLLSENIDLDGIEKKFLEKFLHFFNELPNDSYYNKLMYTFEKIHVVGLLHRVDMTTMAASVEARVPFLDHRLVEFAATVPIKYKLKWNNQADKNKSRLIMSDEISEKYDIPKYLLKKSYEDMIPEAVLYRKKMGFPVPLNDWLGGNFSSYAKKILLSSEAASRDLYNIDNIKELLNNENLTNDKAMKIWMLINIELFIKKYF